MPESSNLNKNELSDFELPASKEPEVETKRETADRGLEKTLEIPEKRVDDLVKTIEEAKEGKAGETATPAAATAPTVQSAARSLPHYQEVEKILEADLGEIFVIMPPAQQQEFKARGEETTSNITRLLNSGKIKFKELSKKVFNLIVDWLKIIPGVNKYFLEQEAKIKSEKILALKKKQ